MCVTGAVAAAVERVGAAVAAAAVTGATSAACCMGFWEPEPSETVALARSSVVT